MMAYYISPRRGSRWVRNADSNRTDVHIPVDVAAEGDEYVVTAYVPGINAEEISIEILEDVVEISGEFATMQDEEVRYLRRERPTGKFTRRLRMPHDLDAEQAKAEVNNGVLTLRVPKAEYAKAKQIAVKAK